MQLLIKKPELEVLARKILQGLATEEELQSAKAEDVLAIKADTGAVHYRATGSMLEKAQGQNKRSRRYIASDETADRMGDVILVQGWDTKRFEENPQALWSHDARSFPIGSVSEIRKAQRDGRAVLLETIDYAEAGTDPRIDTIFKLVEQDILRAVSVGFLPTKATWVEDPKERKRLGLGPMGMLFEKQEQLELSQCTIPANPNALATKSVQDALRELVDSGQITAKDAASVVEIAAPEEKIQIQGVELPVAPQLTATSGYVETSTTAGNANVVEFFELGSDGKLRKCGPPPPPPEEKSTGGDEDEWHVHLMTLAASLESIRSELDGLRRRIDEIPERTSEALTRSSSDQRAAKRTLLASAVEKAREQYAQEQAAKETV